MSNVEDAVIALGGQLNRMTKSIGWRRGYGFKKGFIEFASVDKVDRGFQWVCDREEFEEVAKKIHLGSCSPDWNSEGFPSVGIECEYFRADFNKWVGCTTIGMFGKEMVCAPDGGGFMSGKADNFRPIKSDRDEWIDECAKILHNEHT